MKENQNLTVLLTKNSIFDGLTPEQVNGVLPCIVNAEKSYGKEECVYDKGQTVQNLGLVLDGSLTVLDESADGKRNTITNIEKNQMFGEIVMFSTLGSIPYRVMANKHTRVLFLNGDFFLSPCGQNCEQKHTHQNIIRNMLRLLSDRAIMLNKKIAYLTAPDLKTKIAMYLCELYEMNHTLAFDMPLNRDNLADFFSVARPSLSRELINLKNQGVIDFYRSSVKILDLSALYEIAHGK